MSAQVTGLKAGLELEREERVAEDDEIVQVNGNDKLSGDLSQTQSIYLCVPVICDRACAEQCSVRAVATVCQSPVTHEM